ncbi:tRNA isopentenyltransferase [delta proteobacterium NaphS2]|nr:tRNA isopentenyltransferase [delta proteobacterium NaphS2]
MAGPQKPKVVVIAGPTASGKTSLAVELALSLGAQIINADSMQVYRFMDVGTAKPTLEERQGIPHHLIDVVNPDEDFNAARYRQMALPLAKGLFEKKVPCLVVGGTGLYIRSLLGGLVELPPVNPVIRKNLHEECHAKGTQKLHQKLAEMDPERAESIHPNDSVRIIRALEIMEQTRCSSSDLLKKHQFKNQEVQALTLCLQMERTQLYDRINKRTDKMMAGGLIEETEHLIKKGYGPHLKPMTAIGYRHIVKYLQGEWPLQKAMETLKRDTRRYSKRQMTWFKGEQGVIFVDPLNPIHIERMIRDFLAESP